MRNLLEQMKAETDKICEYIRHYKLDPMQKTFTVKKEGEYHKEFIFRFSEIQVSFSRKFSCKINYYNETETFQENDIQNLRRQAIQSWHIEQLIEQLKTYRNNLIDTEIRKRHKGVWDKLAER